MIFVHFVPLCGKKGEWRDEDEMDGRDACDDHGF